MICVTMYRECNIFWMKNLCNWCILHNILEYGSLALNDDCIVDISCEALADLPDLSTVLSYGISSSLESCESQTGKFLKNQTCYVLRTVPNNWNSFFFSWTQRNIKMLIRDSKIFSRTFHPTSNHLIIWLSTTIFLNSCGILIFFEYSR